MTQTNTLLIAGAGGGGKSGGGSQRVAQESPDTLRSRSMARILDLVCEGEIEGLATGDLRSVYLDETPVVSTNGAYNFTGITMDTRNGTQAQGYISGFPSVESENVVGVEVKASTPITRSVLDSVYTHARVTIGIPRLTQQNTSNGDITGSSVTMAVEVQPSGGSYTEVLRDTITGKTTSRYQRSYRVPLTGTAPWNIRVKRITPDSTSSALQDAVYWDTYTEITDEKLRYPNSALVALLIDAEQFSSIPNRGFDMKLLRIKIPTNANVRPDGTLTYSGSWDGTFKIAWSSNPAWCFYDMLTNDRYGLGAFVDESQVDKWSLYTIGRYCDDLVPTGFGGVEARFTCNLYLQTRAEAYQVLQDMASIFRGMTYWAGGQVVPVQDAPSDPIALYTNSNVVDGAFTYTGSSLKTRHTVALVAWNDPNDFYRQKIEYVEDMAGIARYGVIESNIVATGCTSRGQAHRVGKWLLYSETNETETVSFRAGLDGIVVRPGQIIRVHDADRVGQRLGGRVAAATTTSVTVDSSFVPAAGTGYTLYVTLPNGAVGTSLVASVAGAVLTLSPALAQAPVAGASWMVTSGAVQAQLFRVVSIEESQDGTFAINALKHDPQKYAFVENDLSLNPTPISLLTQPPDPPQDLTIEESLYQTPTDIRVLVSVSWQAVPRAARYSVQYAKDAGNRVTLPETGSNFAEIRDASPGVYTVYVTAISDTGKRSVTNALQKTIYGKTAPPKDVASFALSSIAGGVANLTWDPAEDLDVQVGGSIRIRHSPNTTGVTWSKAIDIGPALPGSSTTATVAHLDGTYFAKFVDSSGNSSINAVSVITNVANTMNYNAVQTITEAAPFAGAKTNTAYDSGLTALILSGGVTVVPTGTYDFASIIDLGGVYVSQVTAAVTAEGFTLNDYIGARTENVSTWPSIAGQVIDDVNAILQVSVTNDNPSGSPVWTDYAPFFIGQYEARAYRFRLALTSQNTANNIAVKQAVVVVDMPDRVETGRNLTTTTAAFTVTFPNAFWQTPAIGITAHNMATGDYYTLTAQSATGFTIRFFNAAGSGIARTFDYLAKGAGRKL